ncbi:AraC family transcriptional regulator [Actinopolymorpha rutila]|uniref:AraC family L-rhamnose operon transcriptional activator RhaR n=1 Tax=Actinopolymorpha rutila TaxID=446787 RepID=A0A852ZJA4_9ACTN|nr:AraC family transcriptional regulator [Actinopolymorpha rutila]NYH93181.1 AraC family L-rhamnose operon transcriptional activator RhaR [Actinopolymorpha rutila]
MVRRRSPAQSPASSVAVLPATYRQHDVFGPGPMPLFASVVRLDGDLEDHAHDFLEIAVVGEGSGRHRTATGSASVQVGDVLVLRPGAWHGFTDCRELQVANCCVGTSDRVADLSFLHVVPELRELLWTAPAAAGRKGVLSTRVAPEAATLAFGEIGRLTEALHGDVNRVLLMARLLTVLGHLVGTPAPARPAPEPRPAVVDAVVRALDNEPEYPWTVERLAGLVNLDPAYLSRLFRHHLGQPPISYLARLRIERASVLLAGTTLQVAQVGAAVGWPDPNYFARRFRALSGLSPTDYRSRCLVSPSSEGPVGQPKR